MPVLPSALGTSRVTRTPRRDRAAMVLVACSASVAVVGRERSQAYRRRRGEDTPPTLRPRRWLSNGGLAGARASVYKRRAMPRAAVFSTNFLDYSQTFVHEEVTHHERYQVEVF